MARLSELWRKWIEIVWNLLFGEQALEGEHPVEQEENGDQPFGEGIVTHRFGEHEKADTAQNGPQNKKTHSLEHRHPGCFPVQVFPFLFELPAPSQDVVSLPQPGNQPGVLHQTRMAIHAMGIGRPIGKPAFQAQPGILILIQQGFFFGLVHKFWRGTSQKPQEQAFRLYPNEKSSFYRFLVY